MMEPNSRYYDKYVKYKNKYLRLKYLNYHGGNKRKTLYHGSPYKLEILEQRTPRGDNKFNTQKGIYFTSDIMEAKLYSMARDPERKNKGFGIKRIDNVPYLILMSELWKEEPIKYKLNDIGYVYVYKTAEYEQNPNPGYETEYIVKFDVVPNKIITISYDDIANNIKYYKKDEMYKLFRNPAKQVS